MGYQKYGVSEIWVSEISGIISDISGIRYIGYRKYWVSQIFTKPRYVFDFRSEDQGRSKKFKSTYKTFVNLKFGHRSSL